MDFYLNDKLLSDEKAFKLFGDVKCLERLDIARDYFDNHPYTESIKFTDGMEIRRNNK